MTITEEPWTVQAHGTAGHQLVQLPLPVLDALGAGDLAFARELYSQALTPYLVADECRGVWKMRAEQVKADPRDAVWVTRVVISTESGAIVGRAGFHGQPDQDGMVEIGYSIDPLYRRQGHGRAAVRILLNAAADDPRVTRIRASIRPDNSPSRNLINQFGFQEVGNQWDEEDGLEVLLEIPTMEWRRIMQQTQ